MSGFNSTVVVPGTHLDSDIGKVKKKNWVPVWNEKFSDRANEFEEKAVIVDYRPVLSNSTNACLVLWNSKLVHCGGYLRKGIPTKKGYLSNKTCKEGHFHLKDEKGWLEHLDEKGFAVIEMELPEYSNLIKSFRRSVQLVNRETIDEKNPTCPSLDKIKQEHIPPLKNKGLQKYYGFAHTPFADKMRGHPSIRGVFEKIHKTNQLICSFDASAISIDTPKTKPGNWLHRDQDQDSFDILSIQGCFVLKSPYSRLAQMVSYRPRERMNPGELKMLHKARDIGGTTTHDNSRIDSKSIPSGRPNPNQFLHLEAYTSETAKRKGDEMYWERFEKLTR